VKDQVVDGVVVESLVVVVLVVVTLVPDVVDDSGLQRERPNKLNEESIESEIGLEFKEVLFVWTKSDAFSEPTVEKSPQFVDKSLDFVFHKLLAKESFHRELD